MTRLAYWITTHLILMRAAGRGQTMLRVVLAATGAGALLLSTRGWQAPDSIILVLGGLAALGCAAWPGGAASLTVIGAAVLMWILRWGIDEVPPFDRTAVLAGLIYLHHSTAALCAAMPVTAPLDPVLLSRWYARASAVLVVTVALGGATYASRRIDGGVWSDILGLAGVVAIVAALAGLTVLAGAGRMRR